MEIYLYLLDFLIHIPITIPNFMWHTFQLWLITCIYLLFYLNEQLPPIEPRISSCYLAFPLYGLTYISLNYLLGNMVSFGIWYDTKVARESNPSTSAISVKICSQASNWRHRRQDKKDKGIKIPYGLTAVTTGFRAEPHHGAPATGPTRPFNKQPLQKSFKQY